MAQKARRKPIEQMDMSELTVLRAQIDRLIESKKA